MKRTLFSVVVIGAGLAIGGFETGDGLPKPPEKEWAARNRALERARIFRSDASLASTPDVTADPNGAVVNPQLTVCRYEALQLVPHAQRQLRRDARLPR